MKNQTETPLSPVNAPSRRAAREGERRHGTSLKENHQTATGNYHVFLSLRFILSTIIYASVLAFVVGRSVRWVWQAKLQQQRVKELLQQRGRAVGTMTTASREVFAKATLHSESHKPFIPDNMPLPRSPHGTPIPPNVFTEKVFKPHRPTIIATPSASMIERNGGVANIAPSQEKHRHHHYVLTDIQHLDVAFLRSEARLAAFLIQLAEEQRTLSVSQDNMLLSYTCHKLGGGYNNINDAGVGCVAILSNQGHVALNTFPRAGILSLDVFDGGDTTHNHEPSIADSTLIHDVEKLLSIHDDTNALPTFIVEPPAFRTVWWTDKNMLQSIAPIVFEQPSSSPTTNSTLPPCCYPLMKDRMAMLDGENENGTDAYKQQQQYHHHHNASSSASGTSGGSLDQIIASSQSSSSTGFEVMMHTIASTSSASDQAHSSGQLA